MNDSKEKESRVKITSGKFGRLTMIGVFINRDIPRPRTYAVCKCDCDGKVIHVPHYRVINGTTTSCGCYRSEVISKRRLTHGLSHTRIHDIWLGIKARCLNERSDGFVNYGGRGITICDEWRDSFVVFHDWAIANGYTDDLSCERMNNDLGYSPLNCKWATIYEQSINKRSTIMLTHEGKTLPIPEWSKIVGISSNMIRQRIKKYNWSTSDALTRPVGDHKKNSVHITMNNETHTLSEWSRITGINHQTISSRLSRGLSAEAALAPIPPSAHQRP